MQPEAIYWSLFTILGAVHLGFLGALAYMVRPSAGRADP
jgi:hypothetical protein